jgi:hypothetical protein
LVEPSRRVVAALGTLAFGLVAVGIGAMVIDAGMPAGSQPSTRGSASGTAGVSWVTSSPSIGAGGSAEVSSSPEPSVSAPLPLTSSSPVASASASARPSGFVATDEAVSYFADDGTVVPVPPVAGLEIKIQNGRAQYSALASNKYGLKVGTYAGEFIPWVVMGQKDGSAAETGGLVLIGAVVRGLINSQLEASEDAVKWIVALPVDIRGSKSGVAVRFDQYGLAGWSSTPRVVVTFDGSLPVVEAVPANGGFHVLVEGLGVTSWQVIDPLRLTLPGDAIDPTHPTNQLLVYGNGKASVTRDVHVDGRVVMGQTMLSATGDVSVSLVVEGSRADLGTDRVLKVGDVPVFVAAN